MVNESQLTDKYGMVLQCFVQDKHRWNLYPDPDDYQTLMMKVIRKKKSLTKYIGNGKDVKHITIYNMPTFRKVR